MINDPADLDDATAEMLNYDGPSCSTVSWKSMKTALRSLWRAANKMLLGDAKVEDAIGAEGGVLV